MNWEATVAISVVVGTLAVVITLIYVGVQIKQNTKVARWATRQSITDLMIETSKDIISDQQLAELLIRELNGEKLDAVERLRLFARAYTALRNWENIHYQYRTGMLTEDEWSGFKLNLEAVFEWPLMHTYWENEGKFYSGAFQKEIAAILKNASKTPDVRTHAYVLPREEERSE